MLLHKLPGLLRRVLIHPIVQIAVLRKLHIGNRLRTVNHLVRPLLKRQRLRRTLTRTGNLIRQVTSRKAVAILLIFVLLQLVRPRQRPVVFEFVVFRAFGVGRGAYVVYFVVGGFFYGAEAFAEAGAAAVVVFVDLFWGVGGCSRVGLFWRGKCFGFFSGSYWDFP